MGKALDAMIPVLPWLVTAFMIFLMAISVLLFRKLSKSREEAEQTREALELELSFFRRFFALIPVVGRYFVKTPAEEEATKNDPNALTISRPLPPVPDPRKSKP